MFIKTTFIALKNEEGEGQAQDARQGDDEPFAGEEETADHFRSALVTV